MITESFPGQFRNWFYALIAESTALTGEAPFRNVFTYALMRDEKGEEMHKSKGNAIWFDDAADEIGVDTMRWLFATVTPEQQPGIRLQRHRRGSPPVHPAALELVLVLRHLRADRRLGAASHADSARGTHAARPLDHLPRQRAGADGPRSLDGYDIATAARAIEHFVVEELSNWYIRRNRRRFWKPESDADKSAAYETLYDALVLVAQTACSDPAVPERGAVPEPRSHDGQRCRRCPST